jgi:hypothetical protein
MSATLQLIEPSLKFACHMISTGPRTPRIMWVLNQKVTEPMALNDRRRFRRGYKSRASIRTLPATPSQ